MITYREHFASKRADGRHTCTMAAQMEAFRHMPQELALPEMTPQPSPTLLGTVQREGYRVEKWEFYPDDYTAVPFLALIPDGASRSHPVPGVMCFPGSNHSKELLAGEPQLNHPNGACDSHADRNQMAKYIVQSGMAAFVFDNPGTGETSILTDPRFGETQWDQRVQFTHGYLDMGFNYVGISAFQKLCFMKHLETLEYVDQDRIGISAHSLGTEIAIAIGLMCESIKVIVFNEFLHNDLRRYVAITEMPEDDMFQNIGNWHNIPGRLRYFGFPELCAAFAPRHLAMTEGGAEEFLDVVRRAYAVCGAEDRLLISYYPAFADPESRRVRGKVPDHGLSKDQFYREYSYCLPEDHSFRREPALRMLKQCFGMRD